MSQQAPIKTPKSRDVVADLCRNLREDSPLRDALEARAAVGEKTYGTRLMTHNGRDALQDAHEEVLDALAYLWQAWMERRSGTDQSLWLSSAWSDLIGVERQIRCLRAQR